MPNFYNLPPRFQKKYFMENNLPEENWDGSSITFQGHPYFSASKSGTNCYQNVSSYNTLPNTLQTTTNAHNIPSGYHTLPNRPRGRGRLPPQFMHDTTPGHTLKSRTADVIKSPSASRPETPQGDRNNFRSIDHLENRCLPIKPNKTILEENSPEHKKNESMHTSHTQGGRNRNDYGQYRDDKWSKREDKMNKTDVGYCSKEWDQQRYVI